MDSNVIRIENWSIGTNDPNPYLSPEQMSLRLAGEVHGHPKIADGIFVHTTRIVGLGENDTVLTKSGSRYMLGEVDPEYEAIYPNAKERTFEALRKLKERS